MLERWRIVGRARILGSLLLVLGVASLLINGLKPRWPGGLRPLDASMEMTQYQEVAQKLAGVVIQARGNNPPNQAGQVCVLLGSSSVMHAVDGGILDAGTPWRWLNLGAKQGNVEDCYRLAQLVFSSELKIEMVVLGLHPNMLSRNPEFLAEERRFDAASSWKAIKNKGWRGALTEIDRLVSVAKSLTFPYATRTNYRVREAAKSIRTLLLLRLGMGLESIYNPATDPWAVDRTTWRGTRTLEQVKSILRTIRARARGLESTVTSRRARSSRICTA